MTDKLRDILRRYGNFMSGYDPDGDYLDIDEALEAIKALIPHIEESEARLELIRRLTARCEQLRDEAKEAKKQERERIEAWGNGDCHHHALMREVNKPLHKKRECQICWQALKGGKNNDSRDLS